MCLSPGSVPLKLAPTQLVGFAMGIWFSRLRPATCSQLGQVVRRRCRWINCLAHHDCDRGRDPDPAAEARKSLMAGRLTTTQLSDTQLLGDPQKQAHIDGSLSGWILTPVN
jgi:hypothetical protein